MTSSFWGILSHASPHGRRMRAMPGCGCKLTVPLVSVNKAGIAGLCYLRYDNVDRSHDITSRDKTRARRQPGVESCGEEQHGPRDPNHGLHEKFQKADPESRKLGAHSNIKEGRSRTGGGRGRRRQSQTRDITEGLTSPFPSRLRGRPRVTSADPKFPGSDNNPSTGTPQSLAGVQRGLRGDVLVYHLWLEHDHAPRW
ncbi:hypothetical protein RRG08_055171 [Elysia crispata]|uniref:Uncharacterized protein n=1 Tax=Elysia crispata TaxID=231223 RepID=A0AAE0Y0K6_9GAST|nr:hypothetical protein RRG08_055171 [Elysia crispata]